jgi:hypothetical protein
MLKLSVTGAGLEKGNSRTDTARRLMAQDTCPPRGRWPPSNLGDPGARAVREDLLSLANALTHDEDDGGSRPQRGGAICHSEASPASCRSAVTEEASPVARHNGCSGDGPP